MIRKVPEGWRIYSKQGRNLGTFPTKAKAREQERLIKHVFDKK